MCISTYTYSCTLMTQKLLMCIHSALIFARFLYSEPRFRTVQRKIDISLIYSVNLQKIVCKHNMYYIVNNFACNTCTSSIYIKCHALPYKVNNKHDEDKQTLRQLVDRICTYIEPN